MADNQSNVLNTMVSRLSADDLSDLCFQLGIDLETLDGTNKKAKIRELLKYLQRSNRSQELIEAGNELRPDIDWADLEWPNFQFFFPAKSRTPKLLFYTVTGLVLIGGILISLLLYYRYFRQYAISPDLTPSLFSFGEANAENIHYFQNNPQLPSSFNWYQFKEKSLLASVEPSLNLEEIDSYLYFQPRLKSSSSWAAIFFWHTLFVPPRNLSDNSETVIILYAEEDDFVEITFKDVHGNEEKLAMPVVSGWAGYRIPFDETKSVDFNKLQLFEFAYSHSVGSHGSNVFKIAHINFQ